MAPSAQLAPEELAQVIAEHEAAMAVLPRPDIPDDFRPPTEDDGSTVCSHLRLDLPNGNTFSLSLGFRKADFSETDLPSAYDALRHSVWVCTEWARLGRIDEIKRHAGVE